MSESKAPLGSPPQDLRHPMPDLQSLQGAYVGNIERLEEEAERMSSRGSDIGEEIRKLQVEQKQSESRRSSLRSVPMDDSNRSANGRNRGASTSSYANSIVDVNSAARWGGYSPQGYITSPVHSSRSGSLSQSALHRQRSGSRTSRLGQVMNTEDDYRGNYEEDYGRNDPLMPSRSQELRLTNHSPPPSHQRSHSSSPHLAETTEQALYDEYQAQQRHDFVDRPPTAASTDTYHQAQTLFRDFDGVHRGSIIEEEDMESPASDKSNMLLRSVPGPPPPMAPLPTQDMLFYPAPVPKKLNLPKRLSQLPSAEVRAKRQTRVLDAMAAENRMSTAFLSDLVQEEADAHDQAPKQHRKSMDPRKSRMSLANLPPQLRASAFFDHSLPAPEIEPKGETAGEKLENILDAAAFAPVSAFTDHPIAGHVGPEVYGKEHSRQHSTIDLSQEADIKKRRTSTLNLISTRRNSSGDPLNKLKKRSSSQDLNRMIVRESTSRMDLSGEFEAEPNEQERDHEANGDGTPTIRPADNGSDLDGEEYQEEEIEEVEEEQPEEPRYFGPPTTLLAELQLRKMQQKSRNKTAATAFPNGMHSTLLELDAVAELEKKKRHNAKVTLAWEAAAENEGADEDSDEDVPLGVLFPERGGLVNKAAAQMSDWDRPLGLIAQRELEDNEPLSRRRERLLGGDPSRIKRRTQLDAPIPTVTTPQPEDDEEGGETLAQRLRRLKNANALDNAIGGVRNSTISGEFASELLGNFGVKDDDTPKSAPAPANEEDETLGQRRARLRAEALARGEDPDGRTSTMPTLKTSHSLADILSAHPIDNTNAVRSVSNDMLLSAHQGSLLQKNEVEKSRLRAGMTEQNRLSSYGSLDKPLLDIGRDSLAVSDNLDPKRLSDMSPGSLLEQNDLKQSRLKADMLDQKRRISSYGTLNQPLVGVAAKASPDHGIAANIQAYRGASGVRTPSMMYTPQMTPQMGVVPGAMPNSRDSYFPPNMMSMGNPYSMNMNMGMNTPGYPMMTPSMINMGGMHMMGGMGGNMGGLPMGMPMNGGMGGMGYQPMNSMPTMSPQRSMVNLPMHMNMAQGAAAMEPPMDPRQRDMVDRWRQSVMPSDRLGPDISQAWTWWRALLEYALEEPFPWELNDGSWGSDGDEV